MPVKQEVDAVLAGRWQVEMMNTPCLSPCTFCYGFWCPCCFVYQQRARLLDITHEPYVCCAGLCPDPCALGCGQPCDSRDPWLFCEACCCTNQAILANRYMVQTRFNIKNDSCDNTLLALVACLNCASMILSLASLASDGDDAAADGCAMLADCVNAVVCSCMLTQHDTEIKRIEAGLEDGTLRYSGVSEYVLAALPPAQQEMIQGFKSSQPIAPAAAAPTYGGAVPVGAATVQGNPVTAMAQGVPAAQVQAAPVMATAQGVPVAEAHATSPMQPPPSTPAGPPPP